MKAQKCKDVIQDELNSRMKELKKARKNEEAREELAENVLAISKEIHYKIELSYGGPQDYFDIVVRDGKVVSGTYHYLDWFDGAVVDLNDEELSLVEDIYLGYLE